MTLKIVRVVFMMFVVFIGLWKMIIDVVIMVMCLRELLMLCVMGFIFESIMKFSCWYSWK